MTISNRTRRALSEIEKELEDLYDCTHEDNAFGLYYLKQQYPLQSDERYVDLGTKTYVYKSLKGGENAVGFFGISSEAGMDVMAFGYRVPGDVLSDCPKVVVSSPEDVKEYLRATKEKFDSVSLERTSQQTISKGGAGVTETLSDFGAVFNPASLEREPPQIVPKRETAPQEVLPVRAAAFLAQVSKGLIERGYKAGDSPAARFYEVERHRTYPDEKYRELAGYRIRFKNGDHHFISILEQKRSDMTDYVAVEYRAKATDVAFPESMRTIPRMTAAVLRSVAIGLRQENRSVIDIFRNTRNSYTANGEGVAILKESAPERKKYRSLLASKPTPMLTPVE